AIVRLGLAAIVLTTAAMAETHAIAAWVALRFAAGVASAWGLVFVSSWGFARAGTVFSGVATGIAATGPVRPARMATQATSSTAWLVLGAISAAGGAIAWPAFAAARAPSANAGIAPMRWDSEAIRLVACYGVFGFGYIIPATFLPAMARAVIADPI